MKNLADDLTTVKEYLIASSNPKKNTILLFIPEPGTLGTILNVLIDNSNQQWFIRIKRSELERVVNELKKDYDEASLLNDAS
jgi:hypothetical protein